jgi:hypothetical protein
VINPWFNCKFPLIWAIPSAWELHPAHAADGLVSTHGLSPPNESLHSAVYKRWAISMSPSIHFHVWFNSGCARITWPISESVHIGANASPGELHDMALTFICPLEMSILEEWHIPESHFKVSYFLYALLSMKTFLQLTPMRESMGNSAEVKSFTWSYISHGNWIWNKPWWLQNLWKMKSPLLHIAIFLKTYYIL